MRRQKPIQLGGCIRRVRKQSSQFSERDAFLLGTTLFDLRRHAILSIFLLTAAQHEAGKFRLKICADRMGFGALKER